ncbi:MetQ/NlpA family ABC transporter substrate-binding protein [Saccharibacillus sp. CPCC 101409]|uniref:MetQ/NlpA family ABC transporter substrate-binding protein n=1 Tax=Saccharibacillus sp. CPCC 101409 TaxID=3058041 RepID=UPI002674178D|nr:MetQ/NlpA family ABC transporter substrate-binding protein [Saccharibacillus sp. CPCC 101409]MDO3411019.1 MetQ/NlpA family ABC transporter substrate-binding protein [Saccharibacillus sp. CPCC 101409]
MKKWLYTVLTLSLVLLLAACGNNSGGTTTTGTGTDAAGSEEPTTTAETVTLKVGASPVPHAEILEHIKPELEKEGVNLDIIQFSDYILPNTQLAEKTIDANFFQTQSYLDVQNEKNGTDLVSVAAVHIEPFAAYSKKIKSIDELKDGATVAIPNDPTNTARALLLLQKQGLITMKEGSDITSSEKDIAENPKNLKFLPLEAAAIPRQLDEVDLGMINANYALEAGLSPGKDALFKEDSDVPYANLLVTRQDNKDSDAVKKLIAALNSDDTKKFIEEKYQGEIIPAF